MSGPNLAEPTQTKAFRDHSDEVFKVVFSPDGQFLVSSGLDRRVIIRYAKSGKVTYMQKFPSYSTAISIANDNRLAIGTSDGNISILDILSNNTILEWENKIPQIENLWQQQGRINWSVYGTLAPGNSFDPYVGIQKQSHLYVSHPTGISLHLLVLTQ